MPPLAILYEHPAWFQPLFAALTRRAIPFAPLHLSNLVLDPENRTPPASVILSRVAMSAPLRAPEHGLFHAEAALAHWAGCGARVLNGAETLAIDRAKSRQLSLLASLGLAIPRTRAVHRTAAITQSAVEIGFPLLIKANCGGAGANIARFDSIEALSTAIETDALPRSIDGVLLVQEYVPARNNVITRLETLAGRFLYALDIVSDGGFDLCPADACIAAPGRAAVRMTNASPPQAIIHAAERIAAAAKLDLGGIEVMLDDRTGTPIFYDINALSNFVANPIQVLGYDPHDNLVDHLEALIERHHP